MPAVSRRHVEIPFGKMHLHAAFGREFDLPVITGFLGGVRAREILRRDIVHPEDADIEIMQGIDVFRDIVDVMEFKFQNTLSTGPLN